ncbi:hypothetical protein DL1_03215 [Thioclava dalianensis]|uniref:Uncharacterized protein n=1 Tax=Thioclava dalianensis TaxID=1185766 RepID=A0A074THM1_9RHOB|nr:hypothetical protein [Thioclava dalianensis]KEP69650.1 hypothetical protein DL1_03215 [Thioclava dalianensis]SFN15861.1 hypothetical protein SAMN05216224_102706 [Thioclava dalianensis]
MDSAKEETSGGNDAEVKRSEARVRRELLEPCEGLKRPRGETAEKFERELARIARRLSYMSDEKLRGLCELVLKQAVNGVWPKPALIVSWAFNLQTPPPPNSDYVASVMRSAMGRAARDGGYLVELFSDAKRLGPPPGRYMLSAIRDRARANARRRDGLRLQIERGETLAPSDRDWLERYHAAYAEAEAMVLGQADVKPDAEGGA